MQSRRIVLIVLALAALVAAGCSDDASTTTDTDSETTATETSSTEESSGDDGDGAETTSGKNGFSDLAKRAQDSEGEPFKITYTMSGAGMAAGGGDTTMTMARDGERAAMIMDQMTLIYPGDGTVIFCTGQQCFEMSEEQAGSGAASIGDAFKAQVDAFEQAAAAAEIETTTDEQIAGRDAICAVFTAAQQGGDVDYCLDAETGTMLRVRSDAAGQEFSMEATEVGEPTDADFTPPADPQPMPGAPG